MKLLPNILSMAALAFSVSPASSAAENLRLRPGISFYQDIDNGFPIICDHLEDIAPDPSKPTLIFFGVSGDLNTNRQARRIVDLYKHYKDDIKFVVVDVDKLTTPESKSFAKTYYTGYVPEQVLVNVHGEKQFDQVGEMEVNVLSARIDKLIK